MRIIQAAAAIVVDPAGRLLLVRRGKEPQRGRWTVPGGKLEPGETPAQAAVRETFEETGARVRAGRELGVVRIPGAGDVVYEIHDFAAEYLDGTLRAGDDAADARWVALGELALLETTDGLLEHLVRFGVLPSQ